MSLNTGSSCLCLPSDGTTRSTLIRFCWAVLLISCLASHPFALGFAVVRRGSQEPLCFHGMCCNVLGPGRWLSWLKHLFHSQGSQQTARTDFNTWAMTYTHPPHNDNNNNALMPYSLFVEQNRIEGTLSGRMFVNKDAIWRGFPASETGIYISLFYNMLTWKLFSFLPVIYYVVFLAYKYGWIPSILRN